MSHEGMVHALEEIHRVLNPSGCLIDLRPARGEVLDGSAPELPTLYGMTHGQTVQAGLLQKANIADHRAATRAIKDALRRGRYLLTSADSFPFRWYFRGLRVLEAYIETRWSGTTLPDPDRRRLQAILRNDPSARIVVEDTFQLNVLKKV